jgi:hypothetical protein
MEKPEGWRKMGTFFRGTGGLRDACFLLLASCFLLLASCFLLHQWDWLMRDGAGVDMGILMSNETGSDARILHRFLCKSYQSFAATSQSREQYSIFDLDCQI